MQSSIQQRGVVSFPAFAEERIYMREIFKDRALPKDISRWQGTVDAMLDGVDVDGPVYLMVDQGIVKAGATHRRPGVHVDGFWDPTLLAHTGMSGDVDDFVPEGLLLASDVLGCRVFVGHYEGEPQEGGDCDHIDVSRLQVVELTPGRTWAGHTRTMLHESIPSAQDCQRTVVRLNVPGWMPQMTKARVKVDQADDFAPRREWLAGLTLITKELKIG